jgi:FkbM family methyltransferase
VKCAPKTAQTFKQMSANQSAVSQSGNTAVNSSAKLPPLPTYQSVGGAALQKTPPLDVKQKKRKSKSNKASSVRRRASKAPKQPDLAAQVAELQGQLVALRAAVEGRETSVESQERVERPRSRASANAQPTPVSSPVESSGYSTGPSHSPLQHAVDAQREGGSPPATAAEQPPSTRAGAKPLPVYELKETRPVGYQSTDLLDSSSEESQDGFFTGLLDRARMQWLIGDWVSLTAYELTSIHSHPQRAKLALLCASAHVQIGNKELSKKFIAYAYEWGVDKRLALKTLIGGLHYSLGRVAYLAGHISEAFLHIENAAAEGFAGLDKDAIALDSAAQKTRLLGFDSSSSFDSKISRGSRDIQSLIDKKCAILPLRGGSQNEEMTAVGYIANNHIPEIVEMLRRDFNIGSPALASASQTLKSIIGNIEAPVLDATELAYRGFNFKFIHTQNDYIPSQIKSRSRFYESDFLEALGYLHSGNGIIIDVGANIGNHTIYFASVLGAKVIAIEPEPHNYFCLVLNSYLNAKHNTIKCWNIACGKEEGRVALEMKLDNNFGSFTASLESNPQSITAPQNHRIEVPIRRLDSLVEKESPISIIKIDVEGMEGDVLDGAEELITRNLPIIAVECFTNKTYLQISAKLRSQGYFPAQVFNATPTFIFISSKNSKHLQGLEKLLANNSIKIATKNNAYCGITQ